MRESQRYIFTADRFAPQETASGETLTPYIAMDAAGDDLSVLNKGMLHFQFRKNASVDEIARIANFLNEHLEEVVYTSNSD